jgi:hypothetical protein
MGATLIQKWEIGSQMVPLYSNFSILTSTFWFLHSDFSILSSSSMTKFTIIFILCLLTGGAVLAQSKPAADLIVTNANIWTVDKSHPTAQAVAVIAERIVAVGTDAEINPWRGSHTRVIDAGGKLLLPGFDDAHTHFVSGGAQLDNVQLNDATSAQEFAHRIAERARKTPSGPRPSCRPKNSLILSPATRPFSSAAMTGTWDWQTRPR